jgi:hypothetical protein
MSMNPSEHVYVDVAIGGVDHRNNIRRFDQVSTNGTADAYTSYQRGTTELVEWVRTHTNEKGNPTVRGFDKATWTPFLPLDFDHTKDPGIALQWLREVIRRLDSWDVPRSAVRYYFSGQKGFHVEIPAALFGGFVPSTELHRCLKQAAGLILGDIPYDGSVYDKLRLWRLPNSRHSKTGLYKVRLTPAEVLTLGIDEIRALAKAPRDTEAIPDLVAIADDDWHAVDALVALWRAAQQAPAHEPRIVPDAITDEARDRQTMAAITASWPYGGPDQAGVSRHADYLLPLLGFLTGRTTAEHAAALAKRGARQANDQDFLTGRHWEAEIDRLAASSAVKRAAGEKIFGLPTLGEQFPALAAVLDALWPAPRLEIPEESGPAGAEDGLAPFPLETLPQVFRDLVQAGAASIVVPPDFIGVPLLIAAGAAIGNALELEIKPGWTEGADLYGGCIGDPGSKKSPALKLASAPLRRIQQRLAREYEQELESYALELATWEGQKKQERGPKPQPPVYQHLFTTDATVEALAPILRDSKGVVLLKDELVGWVKAMDAYRNGRGADRQHYLSWWSRMADKVDRKTAPPIWLPQPFLAVCGTIQPDLLTDLADAAQREDGFVDRLLLAFPDPQRDHFTEASVDPVLLNAVETVFERLYRLAPKQDAEGDPQPHVVRFSPDARRLWKEWYEAYVAERDGETFPHGLRGPWAKFPSQLGRLALILHGLREPEPIQADLSSETLAAAMDLLDYFASHIRKVYRHLGRRQRGMAIKILQALKDHGEMLQRDILHEVFHGHGGERVRSMLEELEAAGLICRRLRESTGGRRGTAWRLA